MVRVGCCLQWKEVPQLLEATLSPGVFELRMVQCECVYMCVCMRVCAYVYIRGRQLSQWRWTCAYSDQGPSSWILIPEGFWELALRSGPQCSLGNHGNR